MEWAARSKAWVRRLQGRPPLQDLYRQLIDAHAPGRSFLDVGCMWKVHGAYAFHAAERGARPVVGLDVRAATREFRERNAAAGEPVRFVQGDVNDAGLVTQLGQLDVVFCSGVLYHVPNPVLTLERLRALCRGTLILGSATIAEQGVPQAAVFLPHLDAAGRRALGYRTADLKIGLDTDFLADEGYTNWFWGFSPSAVEAMARVAGFEVAARHRYRHAVCLVCR